MSEHDRGNPDSLDVQGLDPDDTEQQLHPSEPTTAPDDHADNDFAEEPDDEVNDG